MRAAKPFGGRPPGGLLRANGRMRCDVRADGRRVRAGRSVTKWRKRPSFTSEMSAASAGSQRVSLRVLSWPFRHIRWKIVLPYAFLTVVLAVIGSYLATKAVTDSLQERFENQLAEAGRVTSDKVVRKEKEHLETVRAVAFTDGVANAVKAGDRGALMSLVQPIATNAAVERVEVLDAEGNRVTALRLSNASSLTYEQVSDADVPASWPLVQRVLQGQSDERGDKFAQIIQTSSGYVLWTAGPIVTDSGRAGVVLVGTTLETFVRQSKAEALADVTVYDFTGNPLTSTFPIGERTSAEEASLNMPPAIVDDSIKGSVVREQRSLFSRGYDLLYGRLELRGQVVGLYSVGLSTDFIFNEGSSTRTKVMLLFGVGIALVLGIGLYLTHQLTKPILRLVRTAKLVALGDLTVRSGIITADEIGILATSFDEMTARLQRQHLSTIRALTSAIDARDPYTMGHSVRVGQLAMMLGRELGLEDTRLARLEIGGYLHDIGKIGIRDAVLLKPGKLTPEERTIIEDHPTIGISILSAVDLPEEVVRFVQDHHERLDGSGYPRGLREDEVSIQARIAAVADMYDAVTSERPYRSPMLPGEAVDLLRSEQGRFLDPRVVVAMSAVVDEWEERRKLEPALRGFKLPDLDLPKVTV
ncbi:MAG: HD domain-containing protein [Chloroflexi bacterium]|nr:MAG: HD domain-containing protein [Chloroflexota bacterium]